MKAQGSTRSQQLGLLVRDLRLRAANVLLPNEYDIDVHHTASRSNGDGSGGHLTLAFPMKSHADSAAVQKRLTTLVADLYEAAHGMGTLHYCRLLALDDGTICMLADFDGNLDAVLEDLPKHLGPVLDPVLAHVDDPPPTPVASHVGEFVAWAAPRCITDFAEYKAYPGATARQIRAQATTAGIELDAAEATQLPLLVIMPMKSRIAVLAVEGALKVLKGYLKNGGDSVGTVHFAHLVSLPGNHIGFFTIYDGPFDKYGQDFADRLGPAFDLMFKFTKNPPPTPTSKNAQPFIKWVKDHDLAPLAFYSAYPGLQVQDVRALLAGG